MRNQQSYTSPFLIFQRSMWQIRRYIVMTLFALFANSLLAETVAVIGTGSVGGTLGPRFASLGHEVVYGSRSPESAEVQALVKATSDSASATTQAAAAQQADIVLLAVPWNVAEEVVINLGDLSGKIIIDPINPRVVGEDGYRDYPTYVSNAERIQSLAPHAKVVKAFSTISSDTMRDPELVGHAVTIPLAGNDGEAKAKVAEILHQLGYETIDFGEVRYAHIIEGLYLLRSNARLKDVYFEWHYPERAR